jgi:hypothetical protein
MVVPPSTGALETPVLIIAYRRADTTRRVFDAVREARPKRIYVACNAPRPDRPQETGQCAAVRKIFDEVDWPCDVNRLYRDSHLCARDSISGAISWFFQNEEKGIILEDDCVPVPSFFAFCRELLERYAADQRVAMISGDNFQHGRRRGDASYYFSRYCHVWGWATWRDRWTDSYDPDMRLWPKYRTQVLATLRNPVERFYWSRIFSRMYRRRIDTWDYQWLFASWLNGRVAVVPQDNLVTNIGFGDLAHHTRTVSRAANMPASELAFPLKHPEAVLPDHEADRYTFRHSYLPSPAYILKKLGLVS